MDDLSLPCSALCKWCSCWIPLIPVMILMTLSYVAPFHVFLRRIFRNEAKAPGRPPKIARQGNIKTWAAQRWATIKTTLTVSSCFSIPVSSAGTWRWGSSSRPSRSSSRIIGRFARGFNFLVRTLWPRSTVAAGIASQNCRDGNHDLCRAENSQLLVGSS